MSDTLLEVVLIIQWRPVMGFSQFARITLTTVQGMTCLLPISRTPSRRRAVSTIHSWALRVGAVGVDCVSSSKLPRKSHWKHLLYFQSVLDSEKTESPQQGSQCALIAGTHGYIRYHSTSKSSSRLKFGVSYAFWIAIKHHFLASRELEDYRYLLDLLLCWPPLLVVLLSL